MLDKLQDHKTRRHWRRMRSNEVDPKHRDKKIKHKTTLLIWSFKCKNFTNICLINNKTQLCCHGRGEQCGLK